MFEILVILGAICGMGIMSELVGRSLDKIGFTPEEMEEL